MRRNLSLSVSPRPRGWRPLITLGAALVALAVGGCKEAPAGGAGEDEDLVRRVDAIHFNISAKDKSRGACPSFFSRKGTVCAQRGKAAILEDDTRKAVLELLGEEESWTPPRPVHCWAPRHALVLFDKKNEEVGYIDISLPCGKVRSGDARGVLRTRDGKVYEQLAPKAWKELADLLEGAGLPVSAYSRQAMTEAAAEPLPKAPPAHPSDKGAKAGDEAPKAEPRP